jgi:hypothetical protein
MIYYLVFYVTTYCRRMQAPTKKGVYMRRK